MLVTLGGRVMLSRDMQPENANCPTEVTSAGITMFSRDVQLPNALTPMLTR